MENTIARPSKPPRLWIEPERVNARGIRTHEATWVILDAGKKYRTGVSSLDHPGAARALEKYLIDKHGKRKITKDRQASEVLVVEVIEHYLKVRGPHVASPGLLALRAGNLINFWHDRTLDEIDSLSCGEYVLFRQPSIGGARRELEDLRTALALANKDGICRTKVSVTLPEKPKPRSDYLERGQLARLIWAAYRKRETQTIHKGPRKGEVVQTKKRPLLQVARFLLFATYTGTRSGRVWTASFSKEEGRPWIDTENGVFYREAPGEKASDTKRAPAIRIPRRLLAHLRRWKSGGFDPSKAASYLCEYHKGKPGDPKKAFARLVTDVLGEEGENIVRHSLRHTAATWLLMAGNDPHRIAGYLGMRTDTLIKVYGHHHPDYQEEIGESFTRGEAGRVPKQVIRGVIPPKITDTGPIVT